MLSALISRLRHVKALWRHGLWWKWGLSAYAVGELFAFFRTEIWEPTQENNWRIMQLIPHLSLAWWAAIVLGALLIWTFEASFRETTKLQTQVNALQPASALEITFDDANPYDRFWKTMGVGQPAIAATEHRVLVRNTTNKTIRNVRISVESLGLAPFDPKDMQFQKKNAETMDLPPGHGELVPILWVLPPTEGDAFGETATRLNSPIRVTARGDDVNSAFVDFDYHPEQRPAIILRKTQP